MLHLSSAYQKSVTVGLEGLDLLLLIVCNRCHNTCFVVYLSATFDGSGCSIISTHVRKKRRPMLNIQ